MTWEQAKGWIIMKRIKWSTGVLSVGLFIGSFIMLVPFLVMISTALKSSAEVNSPVFYFLPKVWHFDNFAKAMASGNWGRYMFNSFFVTIVVTTFSLFFNSIAGYAFARLEFRFKNILFMSVMLGLMLPAQVTMVPVFLIMKYIPFAGGNNWAGMGGTGWINTYPGLMVNQMAGAFGIFLCRQFYLNFPRPLDEAAELDGCSIWKTYFQIYLPMSGPLLASLGVIKLTTVWNDYVWPLVITNSENMRTAQLALTMFKNEVVQWELLMAATVVVIMPLILLFIFAQKFFIKGLASSGIKG